MYLFQLRIENEMLQYENYLYKLSIKKKWLSSPKTKKLNSGKKNR